MQSLNQRAHSRVGEVDHTFILGCNNYFTQANVVQVALLRVESGSDMDAPEGTPRGQRERLADLQNNGSRGSSYSPWSRGVAVFLD